MLIIHERKTRLTAALRRTLRGLACREAELQGRRAWLRQRTSLVEVERLLAEAPASVILLEVGPHNLAETLDWIVRGQRDWPHARTAVFLTPALLTSTNLTASPPSAAPYAENAAASRADVEGALREAGASSIIGSVSQLRSLAELALRHRALSPETATAWSDSIWSRLPWET